MGDSIETVWAYRQACQDIRNITRLEVWKAHRRRLARLSEMYRGQQQAKPSQQFTRYMLEAMRPVVTPADVERMVEQDEATP